MTDQLAASLRALQSMDGAVVVHLTSGLRLLGNVKGAGGGLLQLQTEDGCALVNLEAVEALTWRGHWSDHAPS